MPLLQTPNKYYESEESSTEDGKRKRWEEQEEGSDVFRKSKKVVRSPGKSREETDLAEMMKDVLKEVKAIRKDQKNYQEEMRQLREENELMRNNIKLLEKKVESMEKQQRKNNVIIKGYEFKDNEGRAAVEKFISESLKTDVKIKDLHKIKGREGKLAMTVVQMDSWEEKGKLMKNKNKLRGTQNYIQHDLTQTEAKLQKELRDMAKTEKGKGNTTKVGYQKICINDIWWKWNAKTDKLEKMGNHAGVSKNA